MLQVHSWRGGRLHTRHTPHARGSRGVSAWEVLAGATREAMTLATQETIAATRAAREAQARLPVHLGSPEDY
ncbi:hypothetical protein UFOVP823_14 [uncultured Caudovirales phage]|uniref:Uncharacterized protein n=1 Tax=uncultured Caudovirales phage TaxID=2100421 RepID=A0A6J5P6T6_9CAUD|nr:hypothetical protein UFOVP823_14 [uncultured Caudovirales phage]